jgi:hypothetical protein
VACHSSDAQAHRENEIAFPLPTTSCARGREGLGVGVFWVRAHRNEAAFLVHPPPRLIALLRSSPTLPAASRGEGMKKGAARTMRLIRPPIAGQERINPP